jgi:hypothetical protein
MHQNYLCTAKQLDAGTFASAERTEYLAPATDIPDNSPGTRLPEDSGEPYVLCSSPHGGVVQELQMDLSRTSSTSDDDDERPDDCERGALHRCLQRLKREKMKTKWLQIQLSKSQVPLPTSLCLQSTL